MHADMSGVGVLTGLLKSFIEGKVRKNVRFFFGITENATGPESYKPSDILKSYEGS